ncbi:MAG: serine/threonine protein kinase, partial [Planctomycetes bacterium]|nr:serine/threonine protein kinase [Planctomycetota bacterium]
MRIGPYEILGELGRGGMGVVYRAFDPQLQRQVAIKVLAAAAGASSHQRQRFDAEALALARFRHPGVVQLHSAGEERGCPYLVMDYVVGESLEERLERGTLPPADAVTLLIALGHSLTAAHGAGILHRDLKPANVLIRQEDGRPVLIDFGLAKDLAEGALGPTRTGAIVGTPGYWSPEQARGDRTQVGPWTDVYGLGALLYATLTGGPPFRGGHLAEVVIATLNQRAEPPSRSAPEVDSALDRICLRCLAKNPSERYAGPTELVEALEGWQAGARSTGRARGYVLLGVALILVVLGLGVGLAGAFLDPRAEPTPPP